jgi:predicted small secreted protein
MGLGLIATDVKATGSNQNVNHSSLVSKKSETLSEVIQILIRKENAGTKSSATSLTISILEDYQNSNQAYVKVSQEDKNTFNQTINTIFSQVNTISDEKTLNWMKEIKKSATAINTVWAILEEQKVESEISNNFSEQNESLVVVFKK